jgi:hypothetical protein
MVFVDHKPHVVIAPQIYVPLGADDLAANGEEPQPRRTEIPMVWTQEGGDFRLDINLPDSSVLDVYFTTPLGSLYLNGETIWENGVIFSSRGGGVHAEVTPGGLRLTCTKSGSIHILARCMAEAE